MNQRFKSILALSTPILLIWLFSFGLQVTVVANQERFTSWLASYGPYMALIYALVQSITLIIPPLGGAFIWMGMLAVLGPIKGLLLGYFVTTPIYCLNFYLAKKFGRPLVQRVAGKEGMAKIDKFVSEAGVGTLWILKIFENGYFDFISYAAGLTKISYRDFLIVNFIGQIPSSILVYIILIKSPNFVTSMVSIQILAGVLIVISVLVKKLAFKKHATK